MLQPRSVLGLTALAVAVTCVFVAYAILKGSHNKSVFDWPIQPTVYLAVVTAIANSAIAFARMEAIPVSLVGIAKVDSS